MKVRPVLSVRDLNSVFTGDVVFFGGLDARLPSFRLRRLGFCGTSAAKTPPDRVVRAPLTGLGGDRSGAGGLGERCSSSAVAKNVFWTYA